MVSGFFTSPWDHCRILSGLASATRIAWNDSGSFGFSKKLKMSFTLPPNFSRSLPDRSRALRGHPVSSNLQAAPPVLRGAGNRSRVGSGLTRLPVESVPEGPLPLGRGGLEQLDVHRQ